MRIDSHPKRPARRAPAAATEARGDAKNGQVAATGRRFVDVLGEGRRPGVDGAGRSPSVDVSSPLQPAQGTPAQPPQSVAREWVGRALQMEEHVERLIASAGSRSTFSASELIGLQATVFRYSQTVEILSRGTDRIVAGIKQTLGTQV